MTLRTIAALLMAATIGLALPAPAQAANGAQTLYTRALERERVVREQEDRPTLLQLRGLVKTYEAIVRRFPTSGYSDNALWQAGNLALLAHERFGQASDRRTAERLLTLLKRGYPSSSLAKRVDETLDGRDDGKAVASARPKASESVKEETSAPATVAATSGRSADTAPADAAPAKPAKAATAEPTPANPAAEAQAAPGTITLRDIKRSSIDGGVRMTIELDGESAYHVEQIDRPRRVFFDLKNTKAVSALQDATLKFTDEPVPVVRLGRHPNTTTRIVFDMQGAESYSVFTLYNPVRLIIDFKTGPAANASASTTAAVTSTVPAAGVAASKTPVRITAGANDGPAKPDAAPGSASRVPAVAKPGKATAKVRPEVIPDTPPVALVASLPAPELTAAVTVPPAAPAKRAADAVESPKPLPSRALTSPSPILPSPASANADGKFSLSRQLGLGVSRVVIDAGHGGHDPGAQSTGINESELTLDVALRLSRLLEKEPGMDVVLTRDTDVFVPLEERTAIANREGADLFLSIHANASRNAAARGVETYFLNFASNPEAEAVAARENAASARAMHSLPDIVRAIALNNKIDESKDFADMVQRSMVKRLATRNKTLRDLGVKQAPFVVLIGAGMPSVLAEISFVTNRQEGQLLRTGAYRQQIAEALYDAVVRYQQSLKKWKTGAIGIGARQ
ncbi:MAG: N-acetylmuramoyl-L-alanine amidase [Acidobacteriota bacterium]